MKCINHMIISKLLSQNFIHSIHAERLNLKQNTQMPDQDLNRLTTHIVIES
jgi:hypothetical protein